MAASSSNLSPAKNEATERIVSAELIRTLMTGLSRNAALGIAGAFLLALVPTLVNSRIEFTVRAIVWVLFMTIMMVHGILAGRAAGKKKLSIDELIRLEPALVSRAAVASVAWGSSSWLLLPAGSIQAEAFIVMGVAMILMGGCGGHAAHRRTLYAFSLPMAIIFPAGLIRFGDWIHVVLAVGFVVFAVQGILAAMNQADSIRKQIEGSLESESLRAIADSASRAKTAFLAAASHDLRQPLHALTMFLGTLTFHVTTDDAKRLLDRIKETVHVLEEQFNSLLDLSRFDAGAVVADSKPFRLDFVVEKLLDEFRTEAEAKGIALVGATCPAIAFSDPLLIGRLLRNLLDNALKYTSSGSVSVRITEQGNGYLLEVADTGLGIASDHQSRIFDEYVQLTNPGRQRRHGVGLGLAIVKRIDSLLELNIQLQSTVGQGSRFSLTIPAAASDAHPQLHLSSRHSAVPPTNFKTSASIWVLEDDPDALEGLQEQLVAWGAKVTAFTRPEQMLETLRNNGSPPQWLLTDDMLGTSLTGLEVAQILATQFGLPNVCLITGNTQPARLAELRASGFPVIVKPAKPEQLVAILGAAT